MQICKLFAMIDELKPNQYDKEIKIQWLNEIEFKVIEQIINMAEGFNIVFKPYDYDLDNEKHLQIPDPFIDVYSSYIYAKIDFHQSEYDRYNNDVALFNSAFDEFSSWFRRKHMPKQRANQGPF